MRRETIVDRLMHEVVNLGGIFMTRAEVALTLQAEGHPHFVVDLFAFGPRQVAYTDEEITVETGIGGVFWVSQKLFATGHFPKSHVWKE